MKIELKLLRAKKETADGFPLVFEASHQGKRKQRTVGYCKDKHFNDDAKMITGKHPDYDLLAPMLFEYKLLARKIVLERITNVEQAIELLFKTDGSTVRFHAYMDKIVADLEEKILNFNSLGNIIQRNRTAGTLSHRKYIYIQWKRYIPDCKITDLTTKSVDSFKNHLLDKGLSKMTVNSYISAIKAAYNRALEEYNLTDVNKPFKKVFKGIAIRSYSNKKKYITKEAVAVLEGLKLSTSQRKFVDMFLLQIYFGGADLTDLYHLKKSQLRHGRVFFQRVKTESDLMIDLKVHPKAQSIIEKYKSADEEWLFPWDKEDGRYKTFLNSSYQSLNKVQQQYNALAEDNPDMVKIEVFKTGGNLSNKVARHTFANIAKNLMLDGDLIRELMGHERDDVDNFYKDRFPEAVRDNALFKIIE